VKKRKYQQPLSDLVVSVHEEKVESDVAEQRQDEEGLESRNKIMVKMFKVWRAETRS
jgi:hypothetical protein